MSSSSQRSARAFFTPRWMITTVLVIAAVAVMARLGFWQLDRLEERRAFNAAVQAQISAPALDLNAAVPDDIERMEYRAAVVRGVYDPSAEVVLRNQIYQNQPGYHLLTPLRIAGRQEAVLVDRGFIPMDQAKPEARARFAQPGEVTVRGFLRVGHVPRVFGMPDPTLTPGETRLDAWNAVNIERIGQQAPYALLPMYVELAPQEVAAPQEMAAPQDIARAGEAAAEQEVPANVLPANVSYPVPSYSAPDISEGSHLSYAFQWFSFAALLAFGYPIFVRKVLREKSAAGGERGAKTARRWEIPSTHEGTDHE